MGDSDNSNITQKPALAPGAPCLPIGSSAARNLLLPVIAAALVTLGPGLVNLVMWAASLPEDEHAFLLSPGRVSTGENGSITPAQGLVRLG